MNDFSQQNWVEDTKEDLSLSLKQPPSEWQDCSHKEHFSNTADGSTPKLDTYNIVPEGEYEVQYLGYDGPKRVFSADEFRIFLHWQIISTGPFFGAKRFQPFKYYKRYGRRSKFYRNWTIANGSPPKRQSNMTMKVFENKIFMAFVRLVRPVYQEGPLKGKEQDQSMHYSIVDELIKKVQG